MNQKNAQPVLDTDPMNIEILVPCLIRGQLRSVGEKLIVGLADANSLVVANKAAKIAEPDWPS